MAATTTVKVPHLGGTTAGYRLSNGAVDPAKPTVILINSMCTSSALFDEQFANAALTSVANLLAIEALGHGATSSPVDHFSYWDSATVALQVMQALGVSKAFALGTSQGGFIIVRMALLAPDRILGLLPLGTSMDYESAVSREKGAWDPKTTLAPVHDALCSPHPTPDFIIDPGLRDLIVNVGFAGEISPERASFYSSAIEGVYRGDEGRRKLKAAFACLIDRDGLLRRLPDVKCPVYWLQGTKDLVYGTELPKDHVPLFTSSPEVTYTIVENGGHYLNGTSPKETEEAILKMIKTYA